MKRRYQSDQQLIVIQLDLKLISCIMKKIIIRILGEDKMEKYLLVKFI